MSSPSPRRPAGRGAALLNALKQRRQAERVTEVKVEAPATEKADPVASVSEVTQAVEEATISQSIKESLAEKEVVIPRKQFERKPVLRHGTGGREVDLSANYIRLDVAEDAGIFEYIVSYNPTIDLMHERYRLLNEHRGVIGETRMFDGMKLLLPRKLAAESVTVESTRDSGEKVELTIDFRQKKDSGDPDCLAVFNILVKKVFKALKLAEMRSGVTKSFFDPANKNVIAKHKLEVWPGYVVAIDDFEGGVLLQVDTGSKVMRTETVLDLMTSIYKKNSSGYRDAVTKALLGSHLVTRYNYRSYKIDDIDFEASPQSTFTNHKGEEMTFAEYYKKMYDITLKDTQQPLIVSLLKRPGKDEEPSKICLLPELCFLSGMTEAQRADFRIMKDVAEFTRLNPENKQKVLTKLIASIVDCKEAVACLASWGLTISEKTWQGSGRMLPMASLMFGGGYKEAVNAKGDWARATSCKPVLSAVNLKDWIVVIPSKDEKLAKTFLAQMNQQAPKMGLKFAMPKVVLVANDRTESYRNAIVEASKDVQMAMTIFPGSQRADRYAAMKKLCYIERALPNQVVMAKTLMNEKRLSSVVQKILLQINCKLGGELWGCNIPIPGLMFVGVDVFRDKGTSGSVTAVVSTLNGQFSKYHSSVFFDKSGQAGSAHKFEETLAEKVIAAVERYHEVNAGKWPEKVTVFRDGVNAGAYPMAQKEAKVISEQFGKFFAEKGQKKPHLNVVVVQKRINSKFFLNNRGKVENPPAGTVIDHSITLRDWYDFFLIPMNVNQGTVNPVHYVVVHEDEGAGQFKPEIMQRLTFALTHMYFNWPGNIKVPAPCQYAHKLVEMVGEHLHKETHVDLAEKLFYL